MQKHSRLTTQSTAGAARHTAPPRLGTRGTRQKRGAAIYKLTAERRGGEVALQKIRLFVRLTNAILRVLTHRGRFYFLPNFLSTGFGERFCALWRMLHLASAAANSKRWGGGQDRVTPRRQAGAELRISTRS